MFVCQHYYRITITAINHKTFKIDRQWLSDQAITFPSGTTQQWGMGQRLLSIFSEIISNSSSDAIITTQMVQHYIGHACLKKI